MNQRQLKPVAELCSHSAYRQLLAEAKVALANGHSEAALESLENAIALHPAIPEAYIALADAKVELWPQHENFGREALDAYTIALDLCEMHSSVLAKRARLHQKLKDMSSALQDTKTRQTILSEENAFRTRFQKQYNRQVLHNNNNNQATEINAVTQDLFLSQYQLKEPTDYSLFYLENALLKNSDNGQIQTHIIHGCRDLSPQLKIQYYNQIITTYDTPKACLLRGLCYLELENKKQAYDDLIQFFATMDLHDIDAQGLDQCERILAVLRIHGEAKTQMDLGLRYFSEQKFQNATVKFGIALLMASNELQTRKEAANYPEYPQRHRLCSWMLHTGIIYSRMQEGKHAEAALVLEQSLEYPEYRINDFYQPLFEHCYQEGLTAMRHKNYGLAVALFDIIRPLPGTPAYFFAFSSAHIHLGNSGLAQELLDFANKQLNTASEMVFHSAEAKDSSPAVTQQQAHDQQKSDIEKLKDRFFNYIPDIDLSLCQLDAKQSRQELAEDAAIEKKTKKLIDTLSSITPHKFSIKKGLQVTEEQVKQFPHCSATYLKRANLLASAGQVKDAIQDMEYALSIDPYEFMLHRHLITLIQKSTNKSATAVADYQIRADRISILKSAYTQRFYDLYKMYITLDSTARLADIHDAAVKSAELFSGQIAFNSNKYAIALHHYTLQLMLDPEDYVTRTERAFAYLLLNHIGSALKDVDQALQQTAYPRANWLRSILYYKQGKENQARTEMEKCFEQAAFKEHAFFQQSKDVIYKILRMTDSKEPSQLYTQEEEDQFLKKLFQGPDVFTKGKIFASVGIATAVPKEKVEYLRMRSTINLELGQVDAAVIDLAYFLELNNSHAACSAQEIQEHKDFFARKCLDIAANAARTSQESKEEKLAPETARRLFLGYLLSAILSPNPSIYETVLPLFQVGLATLHDTLSCMVVLLQLPDGYIKSTLDRFLEALSDFTEHYKKPDDPEQDKSLLLEFLTSAVTGTYLPYAIREQMKERGHTLNKPVTVFFAHPPKKRHENRPRASTGPAEEKNNSQAQEDELQRQRHKEKLAADKLRKAAQRAKQKEKKQARHLTKRGDFRLFVQETEAKREAYVVNELKIDYSAMSRGNLLDMPLKIELNPVEKTLLEQFDLYNQTKLDGNADTYLVGGSVLDRVREHLLKTKLPKRSGEESDCDITTEMDEAALLNVIGRYSPYKSPNIPNLYQIKIDYNGAKYKIDIRYNKPLKPLRQDAEKRYSGYYYANKLGEVTAPLGKGFLKDLLYGRVNSVYPLETAFNGVIQPGETLETLSEEEKAPLRRLLYVSNSTKRGLTLSKELEDQIRKDKHLLHRPGITASEINAKLTKNFLKRNALNNFEALFKLGLLDTLFPTMVNEIRQDMDWLKVQMVATDSSTGKPNLGYVYAGLLVSVVCTRLDVLHNPYPEMLRFKIARDCEEAVKENPLFVNAFAKVNVNRFLNTLITFWYEEHGILGAKLQPLEPVAYSPYLNAVKHGTREKALDPPLTKEWDRVRN